MIYPVLCDVGRLVHWHPPEGAVRVCRIIATEPDPINPELLCVALMDLAHDGNADLHRPPNEQLSWRTG